MASVLLSTLDACSPPICVGLLVIVCDDGVMVLGLCGLIFPCCCDESGLTPIFPLFFQSFFVFKVFALLSRDVARDPTLTIGH